MVRATGLAPVCTDQDAPSLKFGVSAFHHARKKRTGSVSAPRFALVVL
jgi:hypothetical protein